MRAGQDVALQDGGRDRQARQLVDDLGQPLERRLAAEAAAARPRQPTGDDPVPGRQEARQRDRLDRLDLAPQPRQRPAPERAQHLRVAPLALGAARPELAARARSRRPTSRSSASSTTPIGQPPATRRLAAARNGPWVRAQRARSPSSASVRRAEERDRHSRRRRDAHASRYRAASSIAIQRSSPAIRTRAPPAATPPALEPRCSARLGAPGRAVRAADLVGRQVARAGAAGRGPGPAVAARAPRPAPGARARGRPAPRGRAARAAPPGRAARAAGRGRGSAPAPAARPAARRPRTCRRPRSRTAASWRTARRAAVSTRWTRDLAPRDRRQHLAQRRQVEHVREALAVGLDEDREGAVAAGHGQQVGRALALLPERRPRARPAARQQERPGGVLAEAAANRADCADAADDQVLDLLGVRGTAASSTAGRASPVALGQPDRDAVVRPDRSGPRCPRRSREARLDRHAPTARGPGRRTASGGTTRQSPSSSRKRSTTIRRSVGSAPGGLALVVQIGEQVLGGELVEVVVARAGARAPSRRPVRPARGRPRARG